MSADRRQIVIWSIVAVVLMGAFVIGPIAQDPAYHRFADSRGMFSIPNFWNVITNVPFLVVGMGGLHLLIRGRAAGGLPELGTVYCAFFVGVLATGLGSAYYHFNPTNDTLVWDRIPITVAFVAFFCVILGEHISTKLGRTAFWPLTTLGIASVFYWYVSEQRGSGDLRFYAAMQIVPMLLIPVILYSYPSRLVPVAYLWAVVGAYVAAKIAESLDSPLYAALHVLSGHSIKHLAAAFGTYLFYRALRERTMT